MREEWDWVLGNAQAMRVAWSSLEAALEAGKGCSGQALSKLLEIQGNWAPEAAQDEDRSRGETMIQLLKSAVEKGGRLEEWLEVLAAKSDITVALVVKPNREVPDQALLWQEIEEGTPILDQMTSSLEQADSGIAWAASQWSQGEADVRRERTLGKCVEVMSHLRTLITAGADGLEAGELVRRGLREAQARSIPRVGREGGNNARRKSGKAKTTLSGAEQME